MVAVVAKEGAIALVRILRSGCRSSLALSLRASLNQRGSSTLRQAWNRAIICELSMTFLAGRGPGGCACAIVVDVLLLWRPVIIGSARILNPLLWACKRVQADLKSRGRQSVHFADLVLMLLGGQWHAWLAAGRVDLRADVRA